MKNLQEKELNEYENDKVYRKRPAERRCGMKRIIIYILGIAFVLYCHYWTYKNAYIAGYKQAIEDEIEYIESQTDSIKREIELIDRALTIIENKEWEK